MSKTKEEDVRAFLTERYGADMVTDQNVGMVVAALNEKGTTWTLAHPDHGYTDEQLRDAIELATSNLENWNYPIDIILPADVDRKLIGEAVTYFTGSLDEWVQLADGRWHLTAAGYYSAIGS